MTGNPHPTLIWHVYSLGALGADLSGALRTPARTLHELVDWLPHVTVLGADTILLGPVFASLSHGYDTVDHRVADDRLGMADDLDAFLRAAREAGIGVMLDGAFAYASRDFWRLDDPGEIDEPWFLRDDTGNLVPWRVPSLVTPDYGAPGYRAYVAGVMISWLGRGITGWRLDSAWSVPASFWRPVLATVRAAHPDAWLLGQVFDDDLPTVINSMTYSSATEYAVMHGVRDWLAGGPPAEIVTTLRVHLHNSTRSPVQTFVGNHDFARLADVVGLDRVTAAFALLLTLPGVPAIYYGDEFGLTSPWASSANDADLRPPLLPTDDVVSGAATRRLAHEIATLGAFRRNNGWLTHASLSNVSVDDEGVLGYSVADGSRSITVRINPAGGWTIRDT